MKREINLSAFPLVYFRFSRDEYYIVLSNAKEFIVLDCLTHEVKCRSSQFGGIRFLTSFGLSNIMMIAASGDLAGTSPRYLYFWKYTFPPQVLNTLRVTETIEDCQWNYQYISLITENQLFVYEFSQQVGLIVKIQHYPKNDNFALSMNVPKLPYLLFTSPNEVGNISIYDIAQQRLLNKVQAHQSNVTNLAINPDCTMMATASQTGTIVRVFGVPNGQILYSFRIHNFPVSINYLKFCEKSIYLLCISDNHTKLSIGLVNDAYRKLNLFYYNKYGKEEQEQSQLVMEEDEDGFMSVMNPEEEGGGDDNQSHYSASHRTYFTSQTFNYGHNNDAKEEKSTSALSGLSIFNVFNRQSRQQMMDVTLTGLQKVRAYSQELFKEEPAGTAPPSTSTVSGSPEQTEFSSASRKKAGTTSSIPIHIDKKVTRPLFQSRMAPDFHGFTAILKYVNVETPLLHRSSKDNESLADNNNNNSIADPRGSSNDLVGEVGEQEEVERDYDDNVSELTDTRTIQGLGSVASHHHHHRPDSQRRYLTADDDQDNNNSDDVHSIRSRLSHTKKAMPAFPKVNSKGQPIRKSNPPPNNLILPETNTVAISSEELKLLVLSPQGHYQRIDLNFLFTTNNLWKYNGKKLEPYMTDLIALVEDERILSIDNDI